MYSLTKKQREVLDFIQEFTNTKSISPTYREIQSHFNFSSISSVFQHIQALKKKGCIDLKKYTPRSIQPSESNPSFQASVVQIPFIGTLKVGFPLETFAKIDYISIPSSWVPNPENTYLLKAVGDALFEEQIASGDFLIIEARQEILPGEMALVLINSHDMLLKRYYPEDYFVRLEANNPMYRPIIVRKENLVSQGVLIGIYRTY